MSARFIARATIVALLALVLLFAYCSGARAETSIALGADVKHASGEPAVFVRYDITKEWGVYAIAAGGDHDAFGIGIDYAFNGRLWTARFGAAGWNHANRLNGSPLNFSLTLERRLNKTLHAGALHTSAASFIGLTEQSNLGRNLFYFRLELK